MSAARKERYRQLLSDPKIQAHLKVIRNLEANTSNPYYTQVGGRIYTPGRDHPFKGGDLSTPAYGAYQFKAPTWEGINRELGNTLDIRNPIDQDIAALALFDRRGVLESALNGNVEQFLSGNGVSCGGACGVAWEWASLPPSRYGQSKISIEEYNRRYLEALGNNPGSSLFPPISNSSFPITDNELNSLNQVKRALIGPCDFPPFTRNDRLIYTGCDFITSTPSLAQIVLGSSMHGYKGLETTPLGKLTPLPPAQNPRFLSKDAINPLEGSYVVTSEFGPRWGRLHKGIDLVGRPGQNVLSILPGKVVTSQYNKNGYGYYVRVDHGNGLSTLYAHLTSDIPPVGTSLAKGQIIAKVNGNKNEWGNSTGPHLHFETILNGQAVNPRSLFKF